MGSLHGFEYRYSFTMVTEEEIISLHTEHLIRGFKAFLYQISVIFTLKTRLGVTEFIDSEKFDALTYKHDDEREDILLLSYTAEYRLEEYGMSLDEINSFIKSAVDFAREMSSKPENASLNIIPVAVRLEVCTVQQEGEAYDDAMDRAIAAGKLVPLYLWPQPTAVERKGMTGMLMNFLRGLDRIRVEDMEQGLGLMKDCSICERKPTVGAQITVLSCSHSFHSHCIVRYLEEINVCPCCYRPVYDRYITMGRPFEHQRAAELGEDVACSGTLATTVDWGKLRVRNNPVHIVDLTSPYQQ